MFDWQLLAGQTVFLVEVKIALLTPDLRIGLKVKIFFNVVKPREDLTCSLTGGRVLQIEVMACMSAEF